jgi:ABC-type dipeptide/oligopeptide/nickel transport system permease subunit
MATRKSKVAFNIKRLKGFLSSLRRSKRGLFGIVILIVACVVSVSAPLLTPYDPVARTDLSTDYAAPAWARYLPGGELYSENFMPINDPQLTSASALMEFNVTETPSVENVFVQHSEIGIPNSPGSLEVRFEDSALPVGSSITILIAKDFYYPYLGVPGSITMTSAILLSRIEGVSVRPQLILQQNWLTNLTRTPSAVFGYNVTRFYFGAIDRQDPSKRGQVEVFTEANFTTSRRALSWVYPQQTPTYEAVSPLKQLFPRMGSYKFGIELVITKLAPNAEAVINVDNLNIQLQGTAFGVLGTDGTGRDVYSQLVYGTRISLVVGLLAAFLSVGIGLVVGLVSAYLGGLVDEALMRFTDALLVLPGLPLMIVLMAVLSQSQYNLTTFIIVIGFLGWMGFARVVRSQVLSLKERPYVEAAKAVGAGTPYILARHILPNVIVLVYVTLALSVPGAIVSEAALSFLGFYDPYLMSWGKMLINLNTRPDIWWLVVPPGLCIAILSLSFILLGYALDEILNPKLRMRR